MKKDIHPASYRPVVFEDLNNGDRFLTRSTIKTDDTIKWEDGKDYPLVKVHISSTSHPFFTGQEKLVDIEGRVDRFKARQNAAKAAREAKSSAGKARKNRAEPQKIGSAKATNKSADKTQEKSEE